MNRTKFTNKKVCLIVCKGQINKRLLLNLLNSTKSYKYFTLISADGASNTLYRWKIIPDYIIGDLDSIAAKSLGYFKRKKVKIIKISEQEHNDLEKCILFALSRKMRRIAVIGFAGKRIDHTLNNFSVLKRNYKKCRLSFIDGRFEIFFTNKNIRFRYEKGTSLSLLGMPKAEGIKTYGLKYALNKEALEFGIREGALNEAVMNMVRIEMGKGDLLVFKEHKGKLSF